MNEGAKAIMIGVVALLVGASGAVAVMGGTTVPSKSATLPTEDRAAIEQIVREYILTHPEILPEAMENLERKQAADAVSKNKPQIETAFGTAWEGAADADVTLVQFFDYACGYCKAARGDIERLLSEDKKLRVVYRELPILGDPSVAAARVSLALAKSGGNYGAFHKAMYAGGRPSQSVINSALSAARANESQIKALESSAEVGHEINANMELQRSLHLTGTPSWVVGDKVAVGAVGYDELKKMIADQRAAK